MTSEELLRRLKNKSAESNPSFEHLAAIFSKDLLTQKRFSEDSFLVLNEVLSDPQLFEVEGAGLFLLETYTSLDILSDTQKEKLLNTFVSHYSEYGKENLCFFVGDFIARAYGEEKALATVEALAAKVSSKQQRLGLLLAIDILRKGIDNCESDSLSRLRRLDDQLNL